jgi:hypothetical protein
VDFCEAGQKFPKPFASALPILLRVNLYTRIFSTKICPLAYFTTKLARISCPIAFQVISKIVHLDSFLKTSVEGMLPTMYVDVQWNKILFSQVVSCGPISHWHWKILRRFGRTAVPTRKAVLEETCLALGHWLACCLPWLGKLLLPC